MSGGASRGRQTTPDADDTHNAPGEVLTQDSSTSIKLHRLHLTANSPCHHFPRSPSHHSHQDPLFFVEGRDLLALWALRRRLLFGRRVTLYPDGEYRKLKALMHAGKDALKVFLV